jgi:hypothetical protein
MTVLSDLNYAVESKDVAALDRVPCVGGSPNGIGKRLPTIYKVRFWWEKRSRRIYADRATRGDEYRYYIEVKGRQWPVSHATLDALCGRFPAIVEGCAS